MFLTTCSVCGIFLHMLSYRDRYYWKAEERRESGGDKCEFEELLKSDCQEFDVFGHAARESYDSVRGARGQINSNRVYSVEGADAVI